MEKQLELVVRNDDNKLVLASIVDDMIGICETDSQNAYDQYENLKDALLKAMSDNGLKKTETANYTVSIRENKSKWVFDEERFKKEAGKEVVSAVTVTTKNREVIFDIDKLKEKYPEVYEDCLEVRETETTTIDTNKLWKLLPDVYNKFATEIKPEKLGTINIKRKEA